MTIRPFLRPSVIVTRVSYASERADTTLSPSVDRGRCWRARGRGVAALVDILIEDLCIVIEFDGIAKLGETRGELERAKRDWVVREQNLRDAGWQVVRVNWTDYNDWEGLRIRLIRTLGPMKPAPENRSLWKLPSKRCDGPSRRFYSRTTRIGYEHSDRL